ncbi:MAG: BlaI/MecI/CopY family transcriptional regulator [Oscillospiraceae bacterium]|nr:BlaI/MecI/CopY family transcriptional regulator [Oscillospiraceae bacterium]
MRLTEAERKVMDTVWGGENVTAKEIAAALAESTGWSKTTSYTMITRCISKGYLERRSPNYICVSTLSKNEAAKSDALELLSNYYGGDPHRMLADLLAQAVLCRDDLQKALEG